MPKYRVTVDFEGYSRGYQEYELEAENESYAKLDYSSKDLVGHHIIRDDTEKVVHSIELMKEIIK